MTHVLNYQCPSIKIISDINCKILFNFGVFVHFGVCILMYIFHKNRKKPDFQVKSSPWDCKEERLSRIQFIIAKKVKRFD